MTIYPLAEANGNELTIKSNSLPSLKRDGRNKQGVRALAKIGDLRQLDFSPVMLPLLH